MESKGCKYLLGSYFFLHLPCNLYKTLFTTGNIRAGVCCKKEKKRGSSTRNNRRKIGQFGDQLPLQTFHRLAHGIEPLKMRMCLTKKKRKKCALIFVHYFFSWVGRRKKGEKQMEMKLIKPADLKGGVLLKKSRLKANMSPWF